MKNFPYKYRYKRAEKNKDGVEDKLLHTIVIGVVKDALEDRHEA